MDCLNTFGQSISGKVFNKQGEVIPYVNIYVRQLESGTSTDEEGYYFLSMDPGEYDLVLSSIGYKTTSSIAIVDLNTELNFVLEPSEIQLNEITIKASKKDPAYEIIRNVILKKKEFLSSFNSLKCEAYVKATEIIEDNRKSKTKPEEKKEENDFLKEGEDPFAEAKKQKEAEMAKINMIEMQLTYNFQYPNRVKEERTAYKVYGDKAGLFIPTLAQSDFNVYQNSIRIKEITDVHLVSPLARTAIISYKYKLLSSTQEGDHLVHKIKVIPRKSGNATLSGFLYINDEEWSVNRFELSLNKGSMKIFDELKIEQNYKQVDSGKWFADEINLSYKTKVGKKRIYHGNTNVKFSDLELDYEFPEKFFGNEVATIDQEAYDRDSIYWNQTRPKKLSVEEQKLVLYKDSIETILNSDEYKDSVQQAFNKVEFWEVVYEGLGFRNHQKKESIFLTPALGLIQYDIVGGFRMGPFGTYYRRFENGQSISTWNNFSIGLVDKRFRGRTSTTFRYDPFHLGDITLVLDRGIKPINPFDAYLNLLNASNYYRFDNIGIGHRRELFNGFFFHTYFDRMKRRDLSGFNTYSVFQEIVGEGEEVKFEPYEIFQSDIFIEYTPGQKYMREPFRKVVLGSKYPTFKLRHLKGWNKIFGSDVDWDLIEFSMFQDVVLGVFGNSKYKVMAGQFFNTKELPFIDLKRFRESDPILYSDPLNTFQLLDTSLTSVKPFIEAHWIHHFNGALINNIPLIKKTRIALVVGGGALWIQDQNYNHQELFAGIERTFKLGPRRRLRLGVYGVGAQSTDVGFKGDWKISIDIIDTWKKDWSF